MISTILLNGLWQGAVVTLVAWAAASCVPKHHAASRYAVWLTALAGLVFVPVASSWDVATALPALPAGVVRTTAATSAIAAGAAHGGGNWLLLVWAAGAGICLVRLIVSHVRISQIVRDATPAPELGEHVLLSDRIFVPIAAGLMAPCIVVPAYLAERLEPRDLVAVVAHERGHLRRGDIAGNLAQRVVESLLFFNPWVYIVGRELAREREAACDDFAVAATGLHERYASCLTTIALAARRTHPPLLTPSALGSGRMLVGRVARLLSGKAAPVKTNYVAAALSLLALAALAFVLQASQRAEASQTTASNAALPANCTRSVAVVAPAMPEVAPSDYRPNAMANALVTVAPEGTASQAKIVLSSGSAAIDAATIKAAMNSTYTPAMRNCKATTGTYVFHVQFGPQ